MDIIADRDAHASTPDGKGEDGATRPLPSEHQQQSQAVNFNELVPYLSNQINYITLLIP